MVEVMIKLGRDLTQDELMVINLYRKREFGSVSVVDPRPENEDWGKPYFLVLKDGDVKAFGRLHRIVVEFQGAKYEILGIASVVAIDKAQGYGTQLMREVKNYIAHTRLNAVGFCSPSVASFYEKCGYKTIPHGVKRFRFLDGDGNELPPDHKDDDVLYVDGADRLISRVISDARDVIRAYRGPW